MVIKLGKKQEHSSGFASGLDSVLAQFDFFYVRFHLVSNQVRSMYVVTAI
jgi:hypothetical protein